MHRGNEIGMEQYSIFFITVTGLLLGMVAGFIMHRSDFCIAGIFRDLFLFRSTFKLRSLLLLVATTMLLFELARQVGLLPDRPFLLFGSPSVANLIGGFFFGTGMVLGGGCVVGTLYKMGAGSAISAVALVGVICGSGLYAEFHPAWKSFADATTVFRGKITIPQVVGADPLPLVLASLVVASVLFYRWYRAGQWSRPMYAEGAVQPWQAALLLSLVQLAACVVVGIPMGVTTAYSKIAAYGESLFFARHFAGLTFFKGLPLEYPVPFAGTILKGGPGPALDAFALVQFPLIGGIVLGSTISALSVKEFKIQAKAPLRQYVSAAVGGVMMGLAARMTPACNLWHLLGGLPILACQSVLFTLGMLPGAWLGSILLSKVVIR